MTLWSPLSGKKTDEGDHSVIETVMTVQIKCISGVMTLKNSLSFVPILVTSSCTDFD